VISFGLRGGRTLDGEGEPLTRNQHCADMMFVRSVVAAADVATASAGGEQRPGYDAPAYALLERTSTGRCERPSSDGPGLRPLGVDAGSNNGVGISMLARASHVRVTVHHRHGAGCEPGGDPSGVSQAVAARHLPSRRRCGPRWRPESVNHAKGPPSTSTSARWHGRPAPRKVYCRQQVSEASAEAAPTPSLGRRSPFRAMAGRLPAPSGPATSDLETRRHQQRGSSPCGPESSRVSSMTSQFLRRWDAAARRRPPQQVLGLRPIGRECTGR